MTLGLYILNLAAAYMYYQKIDRLLYVIQREQIFGDNNRMREMDIIAKASLPLQLIFDLSDELKIF